MSHGPMLLGIGSLLQVPSPHVCPCYHPSATTMLVFFMHVLYAQLAFQRIDKNRMVMYTLLNL